MNDAHIYCTKEQIESEVIGVLGMIKHYYDIFGLKNYTFRLSLHEQKHKEKYIDEPENWKHAEDALRKALQKLKVPFYEAKDEAAFYGPKIDVQFKNVYGREETMSTVQLDFAAKKRFNLQYDDENGKKNSDVFVIHRAPLSTHERFIAFLIEHFKGKFPLWLSPVQAIILPIADRHVPYAEEVAKKMRDAKIRVEVDKRAESTPKKVRDAQLERVNYILVVGDKEQQNKTVNVRTRDEVVHGEKKTDVLVKELADEIRSKKI
jgi:threonyl-tRNA synthetase